MCSESAFKSISLWISTLAWLVEGATRGYGTRTTGILAKPKELAFSVTCKAQPPIKWILSGIIRFLRTRYCPFPPNEVFLRLLDHDLFLLTLFLF